VPSLGCPFLHRITYTISKYFIPLHPQRNLPIDCTFSETHPASISLARPPGVNITRSPTWRQYRSLTHPASISLARPPGVNITHLPTRRQYRLLAHLVSISLARPPSVNIACSLTRHQYRSLVHSSACPIQRQAWGELIMFEKRPKRPRRPVG